MRTNRRIASAQERDALLLALSNFREQQIRLRGQLVAFDATNNLALAGKNILVQLEPVKQLAPPH